MTGSLLDISTESSTLMAVPAVHFHHAFAEHVNKMCSSRKTRPDAIAVELGPETVASAVKLIQKIRKNRKTGKPLFPCMLGICKADPKNPIPTGTALLKHIKNSKKWKETGQSSGTNCPVVSLLPLSPTDSMIEAIRCAIELDIPLYGVDIENIEDPVHRSVMLQDTLMAKDNLEKYVNLHLQFADHGRDDLIDDQREEIMAARLKAIMRRHHRVVFTGGMAHWRRIRTLLTDNCIPADENLEEDKAALAHFYPVIIHPLMAIQFMDRFPLIAQTYEKNRIPAFVSHPKFRKSVRTSLLFAQLFQKTCKQFFNGKKKNTIADHRFLDLQTCPDFKQYLINLCMVKQLAVPDLYTAIEAAKSMMSEEFCQEFTWRLMEINWASPADFPKFPVIGASKRNDGNALNAEYIDSMGNRSRPFALNIYPRGTQPELKTNIPWKWSGDVDHITQYSGAGFLRTWPAWDHLLTGLGILAQKKANEKETKKVSTPFEGSLCEGLDIKSTMRAYIKGESRIYVKDLRLRTHSKQSGMFDFVPAVYIFKPGQSRASRWVMHQVSLSYMHHEHVKKSDLFMRAISEKGDYAVSAVNVSENVSINGDGRQKYIKLDVLRGIVVFIPVYFNGIQEARWMEDTQYSSNPFYDGGDFDEFKNKYNEQFGIDLSSTDWEESLIRMAIPFAKKRLMVIAPDGFTPTQTVYSEAENNGIAIHLLPHSSFIREQLIKASRQHCIEPLDKEGLHFPAWAETSINERIDAFKDMMPADLLNYGLEKGGK